MCENCAETIRLLDKHDARVRAENGLQLSRQEILSVVNYAKDWTQRQCICCYSNDIKNCDRMNNIIQVILRTIMGFVQRLPVKLARERRKQAVSESQVSEEAGEPVGKDAGKAENVADNEEKTKESGDKDADNDRKENDDSMMDVENDSDSEPEEESFTYQEKLKLLEFACKVFLMNFPHYFAHKVLVPNAAEELGSHDSEAIGNICEINDPDLSFLLLRNVCFMCDSSGMHALENCFKRATPDTLPFKCGHLLINLIANMRMWMTSTSVTQYIMPLRTSMIRYMCELSDTDLRHAGVRCDYLFTAVKEPLDGSCTLDKQILELAFKFFTSSTLTMRLLGIGQINNQVSIYNENVNNENLDEAHSFGMELCNWLLSKNIVEHIFGPNLHVEIVKHSQLILSFLAVDGHLTNEHLDSIWAASQLKHCGKQVCDVLGTLIKSLELAANRHLTNLLNDYPPAEHNESTVSIICALDKYRWQCYGSSIGGHMQAAIQQQLQPHVGPYAALRGDAADPKGLVKAAKHAHTLSSSESEGDDEAGGRKRPMRPKITKKRRMGMAGKDMEMESTGDEQCCGLPHPHHHHLHDDSLGSESSLGAQSDLSEDSTQEDHLTEVSRPVEKHKFAKHMPGPHPHPHPHPHRRIHPPTQPMDSEECTESSEEEEEDEEDEEEDEEETAILEQAKLQEMRKKKEQMAAMKQRGNTAKLAPSADARKRPEQKAEREKRPEQEDEEGSESEKKLNESSEMEVYGQDLSEGDMDSDELEVMKQAKLVGLKHVYAQDSEESDDLEELDDQHVIMMGNMKKLHHQEAGSSGGGHSVSPEEPVLSKAGPGEREVYDCTNIIQHMQHSRRRMLHNEYTEDIMSPDDGSCHSSRMSTKSEKNMADFDGEEALSEEELAQIHAQAHHQYPPHPGVGPHLSVASFYHSHLARSVIHHHQAGQRERQPPSVASNADFSFEEVCKPGNTLVWDLVQDDKASKLPEGILAEAEKVLHSLVCYCLNRYVKTKFIEACIENLAQHKTVLVSLRLLPKIFTSFNNYRTGGDVLNITMYAERNLNMMHYFFADLVHFTETRNGQNMNSAVLNGFREEVQVRLLFLTMVFTVQCSPDRFRLNQEQVDTLWRCLALNPVCSDDCLSWFLNQAKSRDHHALSVETFRHIFLEKLPQLNPEKMTMIGLNLFQNLSHLTRMSSSSHPTPLTEDQMCGMDQLWRVSLQANDNDVSMTAIQFINNYYVNHGVGQLDREDMFIRRCMENLTSTLSKIKENPPVYLQHMQRGLVLLKNHLELFSRRYAFHLRLWQLDGLPVTPHQAAISGKVASPVRIVLQIAGIPEKTQLELPVTDLVSELRAEVTRLWEIMQRQQRHESELRSAQQGQGQGILSPILGAMLGDGPIRMITLGQELTVDVDDKTLADLQIKDMQPVFVSVGASRPPKKHDGSLPSSCLPMPSRSHIPQSLLTQEPHFGNLFTLMETLSDMGSEVQHLDSQERARVEADALRLSRSVWELLMMLPTCSAHLEGFTLQDADQAGGDAGARINWDKLLPPDSAPRLYYSLLSVEQLAYGKQQHKKALMRTGAGDALAFASEGPSDSGSDSDTTEWINKFVSRGGISHLLSIFMNQTLQPPEGEPWSQWNQECLAYLLRILIQFSVECQDPESSLDDGDSQESPRRRLRRLKGLEDKIIIPRITQSMLKLLKVEAVLKILMQILYDAAVPVDANELYLCSWGRAEVVRCALSLLVSLCYSCSEIRGLQSATPDLTAWLKQLTLQAPESYVRKDACSGLYRLCLGHTADNRHRRDFLVPITASLLTALEDAVLFKPKQGSEVEGKEPFGPGCRDYFWLVCQLVERVGKEEFLAEQRDDSIDLQALVCHCTSLIASRPCYETRHGGEEDDALCGLLRLQSAVLKYSPQLKASVEGRALVQKTFSHIYELPSISQRHLPKCKSSASRSASYDLLIELCRGNPQNYSLLQGLLMRQHKKDSHLPYPFEYWPQDDGRSKAGYCGIQNLGATCYMAAALQFLFFIPDLRESILQAKVNDCVRHRDVLMELQKMFAYLQESERKSYNPKSFCKNYIMDNQPLNTGEQKDMTEFFTDLITKIEEMSPDLKVKIKELFGGVIVNNVRSLDCPHVSRTFEEFYTVRCQVSDLKDLYASLNEVTVKDMLEGDNKYVCADDDCKRPVRAEKRACFAQLPSFLAFNTMRYTFNINSMQKEKVNTYFSFPRQLDMSPYMEHNIYGEAVGEECEQESYQYELMGVTVHTGTADGGHYYSFICPDMDKKNSECPEFWLLCNDAEVKPFDANQLDMECFGGEMTSKTYDSVNDKYMDLSFEKTNSAYMLFYKRVPKDKHPGLYNFELCPELAEWVWQDNQQYLKDRSLFEHSNFNFLWQVCGFLPSTMPKAVDAPHGTLLQATQLTASFVLETLIHSKEKPTMLQWIETLTKQFIACPEACEWFMNHMANDDWWPLQILIKCPNQMVRQLFYRLLIHVTNLLRGEHAKLFLQPSVSTDDDDFDLAELGNQSCVTRFIKKLLSIIGHGVRPHSKYLTEYFGFLLEFAKQGEEECSFLTNINCISTMVAFYMGQKQQENYVEILSDDEEEEEVLTLTEENKPTALEKMVSLIALLVEKSRGSDNELHLSQKDCNAILFCGRGFPFLMNQIRDQLNIRQTTNIIYSFSRWNESLAVNIVHTIFLAIKKLGPEYLKNGAPNPVFQHAQPFLKLLTLLVEFSSGSVAPPPGLPCFIQVILHKMWDLAKMAPQSVLDWLSAQVVRNETAHAWVLEQLDLWVEQYLIASNHTRVRLAAACLLISLVPCPPLRQLFRTARNFQPIRDIQVAAANITPVALEILHKIYKHLLKLLQCAKNYVDPQVHGTMKLVCYFNLMQFCVLGKKEKMMFGDHFDNLWQLFQPKLLEPQIATHHNKQALLQFWHGVCVECPENIQLITSNAHVCKNIAFNYILADHEDQDIVVFNRLMLPSYYGLLRLCCQHSRAFTRQLAQHQNIQWAFKNILPYPTQYANAVDELNKMMQLMSVRYADNTEEEVRGISLFRRTTIAMYNRDLDARSHWQTLLNALKVLMVGNEERLLFLYQNGLSTLTESYATLHLMYHEATACHVSSDITDLLNLMQQCLKTVRECIDKKAQSSNDMKGILLNWKDRSEFVKKLLNVLNSYTPPDMRAASFEVLKQMILTLQPEMISLMVPYLCHAHTMFQESNNVRKFGQHKEPFAHSGPYFPRRGHKMLTGKSSMRPLRPQFQMMLAPSLLESSKGVDETYDQQVYSFFLPYHLLIDTLQRLAINLNSFSQSLINLGAMVAFEGVSLHLPFFAKLWNEIYFSNSADLDRTMIAMLCKSQPFLHYCEAVLMDERPSLNNPYIFNFFSNFFPKVHERVFEGRVSIFLDSLVASTMSECAALETIHSDRDLITVFNRIGGDVRAMLLLFTVLGQPSVNTLLVESLRRILRVCHHDRHRRLSAATRAARPPSDEVNVDDSEPRPEPEKVADSQSQQAGQVVSKSCGDDARPSTSQASPDCGGGSGDGGEGGVGSSGCAERKEGEEDRGSSETVPEPASQGCSKGEAKDVADSTPGTSSECSDSALVDGSKGDKVKDSAEAEVSKEGSGSQGGDGEVMCAEVSEASESIEVCTTPEQSHHHLKRPLSDGAVGQPDEPIAKKKCDSEADSSADKPSDSNTKSQEEKSDCVTTSENPEPSSSSSKEAEPAPQSSEEGVAGTSKGGQSSRPSSPDSSVKDPPNPQPAPSSGERGSGQRLERGNSREGEEGPSTSTSQHALGPGPMQRHVVDRVAANIEQLLQLLER